LGVGRTLCGDNRVTEIERENRALADRREVFASSRTSVCLCLYVFVAHASCVLPAVRCQLCVASCALPAVRCQLCVASCALPAMVCAYNSALRTTNAAFRGGATLKPYTP